MKSNSSQMLGRLTQGICRFFGLMVAVTFVSVGARAQLTSEMGSPSSYEQVKEKLHEIAQANPKTARVVEVGDSDSGEKILALEVGGGTIHNLLVATHHGNEYGSTVVALAFAEALAQKPIANQTLYVIPVLNIGGFNKNDRYESARGITYDPNRDYPGPCGTEGPHKLKSTAALANFIDQKNIITSATLHTFYPGACYPWGFPTHDLSTSYDAIYKELGRLSTLDSQYPVGNSTELIYPAQGAYEDYAFWKHGIWSYLFELGTSHDPSDADLQTMIAVNIPGFYRYFENAPTSRAADHGFSGSCDARLSILDRHDE